MVKYLTQEGLEKLKKELEYLRNHKRKEIALRLKRAADFGDLSENAAYHEAKEAQADLENRIRELRKTIGSAVVVKKNKNKGQVEIGSTVQVSSKNGKEKFKIVGEEESDPLKGKISYTSPLGEALLNKKEGEIVEIGTVGGKVKYKIVKIFLEDDK